MDVRGCSQVRTHAFSIVSQTIRRLPSHAKSRVLRDLDKVFIAALLYIAFNLLTWIAHELEFDRMFWIRAFFAFDKHSGVIFVHKSEDGLSLVTRSVVREILDVILDAPGFPGLLLPFLEKTL